LAGIKSRIIFDQLAQVTAAEINNVRDEIITGLSVLNAFMDTPTGVFCSQ